MIAFHLCDFRIEKQTIVQTSTERPQDKTNDCDIAFTEEALTAE